MMTPIIGEASSDIFVRGFLKGIGEDELNTDIHYRLSTLSHIYTHIHIHIHTRYVLQIRIVTHVHMNLRIKNVDLCN